MAKSNTEARPDLPGDGCSCPSPDKSEVEVRKASKRREGAGPSGQAATPAAAEGSTETQPSGPKQKKRRRGRPPVQEEQRRREILRRYSQNDPSKRSRAQFCEDEGITIADLEKYQMWKSKRVERGRWGE